MNVTNKRLLPGPPDGEPLSKKAKNQPSEHKELILLPYELILKILNHISSNGSLLMTELSRGTAFYMESQWKLLSEYERLNFDWAECQTQKYPEKFRYMQGRGLLDYIESRPYVFAFIDPTIIESTEGWSVHVPNINQDITWTFCGQIKRLYSSFKKRMLTFPALGAYIWSDLTYLAQLTSNPAKFLPNEGNFFESEKNPFQNSPSKNQAGDELLRGLFYLTQFSKEIFNYIPSTKRYFLKLSGCSNFYSAAFNCLNRAIIKKATCASYLAIKILAPLTLYNNGLNSTLCQDLAIASSGQADYRGLEGFLNSFFSPNEQLTHYFYLGGRHFPPVLARKAFLEENLSFRERLLEQAIENYGLHVPDEVWKNLIETKTSLGKEEEVQEIIKRSMNGYKDNIWYEKALSRKAAFEAIIDIRYKAKSLSDKIWHFKETEVPIHVSSHYLSHDHLKIEFEQISQMNFMMDIALKIFGRTIPLDAWIHAGILKMYAKQFDQALSLISQGIEAYGNEVPDFAYTALQVLMEILPPSKGHFDPLKKLIPAKLWMSVHDYLLTADDQEEGLFCIEQALNAYGQQIPIKACLQAADLYAYLNRFDESNLWLQKGIAIYRQDKDIDFHDYLNLLIENINTRNRRECFTGAEEVIHQALSDAIPLIKTNLNNPNLLDPHSDFRRSFWPPFLETYGGLQHPSSIMIRSYDRQIQGYLLGALCFACIKENPNLERIRILYIDQGSSVPCDEKAPRVISELENWIEEAIAAYDHTPPSWIWATAVKIKKALHKEKEAERILTTYPEIKKEFNLYV